MTLPSGIVYGPVVSRRLGRTLGVNLAPVGHKACTFACAYCRYAGTPPAARRDWPDVAEVIGAVEHALESCGAIDAITVAGSGEPTLHPGFAPIAEGLFLARERLAPGATLALLSNGSTLGRVEVRHALARFDSRSMKLDAGDATTFRLVNAAPITLGRLIGDLRSLGRLTLHSRFVRDADGIVDNTTPNAVNAWLEAIRRIQPDGVDLCTLDATPPPQSSLRRASAETLEGIAAQVRALAVPARVFA